VRKETGIDVVTVQWPRTIFRPELGGARMPGVQEALAGREGETFSVSELKDFTPAGYIRTKPVRVK